MHDVEELMAVDDPAWPSLERRLLGAGPATQVLPITDDDGERCLWQLQVSARSTLGALARHTGGVLVDHGWLRLLGGGGDGLPDLATANDLLDPEVEVTPPFLLVAIDVVGGRFALNGGGLPGSPGEVVYWAPDVLDWEPMGLGYTDFVHWSLTAGLEQLCGDLRWAGWEDEVMAVGLDEGLFIYPPLATAESRPIESTSRRPVPWTELTAFLDDLAELPNGAIQVIPEP